MTTSEFLKETIKLKRNIEFSFLDLGARLQKIRDFRMYEGYYTTFKEFLDEIRVTESTASKLITIHNRFVDEFKMDKTKLSEVKNWTSLYLIAKHAESIEDATELVDMATKVRRADLEDELRERKTGCTEHKFGDERLILAKCIICGRWVRQD